jgi:hypothetical protein
MKDDTHLNIDLEVRGQNMERLARKERVGPADVVRVLNAVLRKEGSCNRLYTKTLMRNHKENDEIAPPEDDFIVSVEDLLDISEVAAGA